MSKCYNWTICHLNLLSLIASGSQEGNEDLTTPISSETKYVIVPEKRDLNEAIMKSEIYTFFVSSQEALQHELQSLYISQSSPKL